MTTAKLLLNHEQAIRAVETLLESFLDEEGFELMAHIVDQQPVISVRDLVVQLIETCGGLHVLDAMQGGYAEEMFGGDKGGSAA